MSIYYFNPTVLHLLYIYIYIHTHTITCISKRYSDFFDTVFSKFQTAWRRARWAWFKWWWQRENLFDIKSLIFFFNQACMWSDLCIINYPCRVPQSTVLYLHYCCMREIRDLSYSIKAQPSALLIWTSQAECLMESCPILYIFILLIFIFRLVCM
jgi:hypothetical protein